MKLTTKQLRKIVNEEMSRLVEETPPEDVERELGGAQSVLHGEDKGSSDAGKKLGSAMMGLLDKHRAQLKSFVGKGVDAKVVAKAAAQYIASRLPDVLTLASEGKKRGKLVERNMSYVRFENTCRDLEDCYYNMDDPNLSASEESYRGELIDMCRRIVNDFGDNDFSEENEMHDDEDELS